jgi:FKBP-type peptidyl-prolyl cis-trans isomerase
MKNISTIQHFILIGVILVANVFQNCGPSKLPNQSNDEISFIESPSGLKYKIIREGHGDAVKAGYEILLHETLSYRNDSLLFDSRKLPNPIKVLVGANQVIKGIEEALVGMKKGEIKKLIVPPALSKRTGAHSFTHPDSRWFMKLK